MMLSPSRLTVLAAGIKGVGTRQAKEACRCAMCGTTIQQGELLDDFSPGDSFTDYPSLACPTSKVICGDCKAVWRKEFMQKYSKAVITAEGIFPFAKMENQAYWLLNPPSTPFLIIVSDQQQQHLVWRAPVNRSRDIYQIRYGGSVLTIRPKKLAEALEASAFLVERVNQGLGKGMKAIKNPFERLDWEMKDLRHGRLRRDVLSLLNEPSADEARIKNSIALLQGMSAGEMWAMCAMLSGKLPVKPEPVLSPKNPLAV